MLELNPEQDNFIDFNSIDKKLDKAIFEMKKYLVFK